MFLREVRVSEVQVVAIEEGGANTQLEMSSTISSWRCTPSVSFPYLDTLPCHRLSVTSKQFAADSSSATTRTSNRNGHDDDDDDDGVGIDPECRMTDSEEVLAIEGDTNKGWVRFFPRFFPPN